VVAVSSSQSHIKGEHFMFSNRPVNICLIEDEEYDVRRIKNTIRPFKDKLILRKIVSEGEAALEAIQQGNSDYDVVIMDFQIAGSLSGETLIKRIKEIDPTIQIVVVTKMTINITDFDFANRLIEAGAMWYCTKYPGDIEDYIYQPTDFVLSLFNAAEKRTLEKERQKSRKKLDQTIRNLLTEKQIIGESDIIKEVREEISRAAEANATILIQGASGTGKELVATHIHYLSKRRFENFIPINCGSLPQELIESELFGFEKGSFTGAQNKKPGLLEIANNGSVFLDEVGELPASAQSKLLRFLQDGEIDKIGRTGRIKVNVRIIAASNKNLKNEIREKRFREDLYYRLNVFPIWVPPLKDHPDDISHLVKYFLLKFSRDMSREMPEIGKKALQQLERYHWPGNVRELQNIVQRLILKTDGIIDEKDVNAIIGFPDELEIHDDSKDHRNWNPQNILPLREMENDFRQRYFNFVRQHSGSDAEAARKLGLAPPNYYRMCKELGIK
jgi:two-component system response regulator AtoC